MQTEPRLQKTQRSSLPNKVFVLALDGATFDLIQPWAEAGKLPLFAELMQKGAWGQVKSTTPPITPVAWLSFATGKNPGKHGVFNFFRPVREDYAAVVPATSHINSEVTLWELLSQRGRRVCVVNVPMTFPPKAVNGVLYAGVPMPAGEASHSYPPSLHDELMRLGWDLRKNAGYSRGDYAEFLRYLIDLVKMRTDAVTHLMAQQAWDFFMVHYLETDQVAHMYWRFMENEPADHPLHDAMLRLFQAVETQMQRILQTLPDDATLLVVSDHGVGPVHYHLHLNNWLLQEGFLRWQGNLSTHLRRLSYQLGLNPTNLYRWIPKTILQRLTLGETRTEIAQIQREDQLPQVRKSLLQRWFAKAMRLPFLYLDDIDWSRSVAYSGDTTQNGILYLNLKGREPQGVVEAGADYEALREKIRQRLEAWVNPQTGQKMVSQVCFREELYSGSHVESAPDLIFFYNEPDYESRKGAIFLSHKAIEPIQNAFATHRLMGMWMLYGPGIQPGRQALIPTLLDMAPLILYLMDEEIPSDLEGVLPKSLIAQEMLAQRSPRWGAATVSSANSEPALSTEDEAILVEQLRKLGYVA